MTVASFLSLSYNDENRRQTLRWESASSNAAFRYNPFPRKDDGRAPRGSGPRSPAAKAFKEIIKGGTV